jgi:hypothetical protein
MSLVGCTASAPSPVAAETPPLQITLASSPSPVPSPTPTLTPVPATPTRTPRPTRTPTPTPLPTRTTDEQRALMVEMLETNGGCELPCWWGVTPGQSDWQAVRDYFQTHRLWTLDMPHPDRLFDYCIGFDFSEKDGLVESIEVNSEVFRGATSERFARDWRCYSPDQILNRYGVPSQVYLQLVPLIERDSPVYYVLNLVYDELGFYITYLGPATDEPPTMRFCPRFQEVTQIGLYLKSPQPGQSIMGSAVRMRTLEEATGMDVATYYETFGDPASEVCLESPSDIWP